MSGTPRTDFRPDPRHSQHTALRLQPQAQDDLRVILRQGKAKSISDAIHRALRREARAVRRSRRAA